MKLRIQGPDGVRFADFNDSGGPVVAGRGEAAQVRLLDAGRGLSREHVEFRAVNGAVRLTVLSKVAAATTNKGAVASGQSIDLRVGDSVTLGAYVIAIEAESPVAPGPGFGSPPGPPPAGGLADWLQQPADTSSRPQGSGEFQIPAMHQRESGSFSAGTADPGAGHAGLDRMPLPQAGPEADRGLDVIGNFLGEADLSMGGTGSSVPTPPPLVIEQRHAAYPPPPWSPPPAGPVPTPPLPPPALTGDWANIFDQIHGVVPAVPAAVAEPLPLPLELEIPVPVEPVAAPPVPLDERTVRRDPPPVVDPPTGFDTTAFAEGLGVPVPEDMTAQDWRRIGSTLRQLTDALNQLMLDRAALKGEMRAYNKTQVYMSENNPYKARLPVNELLELMLFGSDNAGAFMRADKAVREAIDDLRAHNLAIIAASRASVEGTVREFSPDQLKRHLSTGKAAKVIAFMEHGQLWKSYVGYYQDKSTHMADWLEALFERHFVDTYSREADRLSQQHILLP